MSPVHPEAAVGFDRAAADYERGRPGYPAAAMTILARELAIGPGRRIVDLAAGTGKLTRSLIDLGAEVVAVEPVAGMRTALQQAVPGVEIHEGTAEQIPLGDGTVDAVLVAQAFHWFDVPAASAEIHRVLVAGGGLAVVRNEWDRSVPWVDALQQLIRGQPQHEPRHPAVQWRAQLEATGRFTPLSEEVVPNLVSGDLATLRARVASLSFIATMPAPRRDRLLDEVSDLIAEHHVTGPDGSLPTPYRTHVLWGRRLSTPRPDPRPRRRGRRGPGWIVAMRSPLQAALAWTAPFVGARCRRRLHSPTASSSAIRSWTGCTTSTPC